MEPKKPQMTIDQGAAITRGIPREPLRSYVPSRTHKGQPHLVDLEENNFNGQCSCRHFETRLAPLIREPDWEPCAETRCWHILCAREAFLNRTLKQVAAQANGVKS